jgi:dTDP-glucose 4,6-dehydratase
MLKNAIVVTGGSTFVGTNLIKFLLDTTDVSIIDVEQRRDKYINNFHVSYPDRYVHENVSISDGVEIDNILKYYRPVGVVHLAVPSTSLDRNWNNREAVNDNLVNSFMLADSIIKYVGNRRSIKDNFKVIQLYREDVPESITQYYTSKISAEGVVDNLCEKFDICCINIQYGTMFGKYQPTHECIPSIIIDLILNKPIKMVDRPINLIHIDDILPCIYNSLDNILCNSSVNSNSTSVNEVATVIATLLDDMIDVPDGRESYTEMITAVEIDELDEESEYVKRLIELIMWYNLIIPKE